MHTAIGSLELQATPGAGRRAESLSAAWRSGSLGHGKVSLAIRMIPCG